MRVLWITNIVLPEAQKLLAGNGTLKSTGGWLVGASDALTAIENIQLTIATVSNAVTKLTRLQGDKITYYLLPYGKGNKRKNKEYIPFWKTVNEEVRPDVIHLHGTECSHGLAYIDACGANHVCVSIQGLVSVYKYYFYLGLTKKDIFYSITPASIYFGGIFKGYKEFCTKSIHEKEILRRVDHIIGRTTWDRSHTWAINPDAHYYYGGETLRTEFYSGLKWKYENCCHHTIFVSQAGYPIKGLHMLLRAMPLVKRKFPDVKIRVAGTDITRCDTLKSRLLLGNYGNLIRKIVRANDLNDCIAFIGSLDAESMIREYLNANVFVCPSTIENSPNSLGEAQILGVPVIASYVGGIPDMMQGDEEHLYRFEEVEMLAFKLVQLFEQEDRVDTTAMRKLAISRHDPVNNLQQLLTIYQDVSR